MMKKILMVGMMFVFAFASVYGQGADVQECLDAGFDFYIEKFQCGSETPETDNTDWDIDVEWSAAAECVSVSWTADPAVDGVTEKAGVNPIVVHDGGTSGGFVKTYDQAISHISFCGNFDEPYCGDGEVNGEEACEYDADCPTGYICDACECYEIPPQPYCGDGNLDLGEQCDDGNNADGDGCSANCTVEDSQIPEFTAIGAGIALLGAGAFILSRKKN